MQFVDLRGQYESLKPEVDAAIERVISNSGFIGGTEVEAFEARYASLLDAKHCVSCANGTDALYISLRALGAGPGDEVITTAHSWISTSETITQTGARVVFSDTEDEYFCIDPAKIEEKITERTKGIIVVHLYGQPSDLDRILALARKHGLWLIEDCAQAHLAEYNSRKVGTFGDVATFSFYPGKNLGAMGDAGCLVTSRDDVAEFASFFARHGGKNDHIMEGICSRMDGLQAAILNVKMEKLIEWNQARRRIADRYAELLGGIVDVRIPAVRAACAHVFHLYVLRVPWRNQLKSWLNQRGIPTGVHYPRPLPFYPAYAYLGHLPSDFPIAHRHASEILSLPMHPLLTSGQQEQITDAIVAFFSQRKGRRN